MPVFYVLDLKNRLVKTTMKGAVTFAELLDFRQALQDDPDFRPDFNQLIDCTQATEEVLSAEDVERLAGQQFFSNTSKRAFVANKDLTFGLVRMFTIHCEIKGLTNQIVFRDKKAALRWLSEEDI